MIRLIDAKPVEKVAFELLEKSVARLSGLKSLNSKKTFLMSPEESATAFFRGRLIMIKSY